MYRFRWIRTGYFRLLTGLFALLALYAMVSCAHESAWQSRVEWTDWDVQDVPGQADYPDAGAIVLLDEGKMKLTDGNDISFSTFEKHRVVKILNSSGRQYANIVIPYNPASDIDYIQARTISPDGKITVLKDDDIYDVTMFPNFIFYSDQRAKRFTMPAVEDGSIIEYRYQLTIWNLTYWHAWLFQEEAPVLHSKFTLSAPSEQKVHYRTYGIDLKPQVIDAPQGFNSTYTWETRNVPALRSEVGMPSMSETIQHLVLAPIGITEWSQVAQWYDDLVKTQTTANKEIKQLAARLSAGTDSKAEIMQNIYEWVRDQVRYIAVEIGVGGFQPHAVSSVLTNQYGDCKDMVTLLCTIAREAGIETHQALVRTWTNGTPDTTLPSQFQFNHVIAYAPEISSQGVWMDPTEKGMEFGRLPWYDQGLPVLLIGQKGGGTLVTTPRDSASENQVTLNWDVDLQSSGAAVIHGTKEFRGAPASELREDLIPSSPHDRRRWMETQLTDLCSGVALDSLRITGLEPVRDPLTFHYTFHTKTFTVPRSDQMVIRPGSISSFDYPDYFRSQTRRYPVRFKFGTKREIQLDIRLPEEWQPDLPAFTDSVSSDFGWARWGWSTDGRIFRARTTYVMDGRDVPPGRYGEFQSFLDTLRTNDLRELLVVKHADQIAMPEPVRQPAVDPLPSER